MKITTFVNDIAAENTYLLTANDGSQLLIDPGSSPESYLAASNRLLAILLTHAHFDHIIGIPKVLEKFPNLPIWLHEAEKDWTHLPDYNASSLMLGKPVIVPDATNYYSITHNLKLGSFEFEVRETPGHSIGSISLISKEDKLVFDGDALFAGSIGRCDLPSGNYRQLLTSIKTELFSLPEDYSVFPGHGLRTTIVREKSNNPFFN